MKEWICVCLLIDPIYIYIYDDWESENESKLFTDKRIKTKIKCP